MYYIGVDIGGTFTDCVAVDDDGRASTPRRCRRSDDARRRRARRPRAARRGGRRSRPAGAARGRRRLSATAPRSARTRGRAQAAPQVGLLTTRGHGDALPMMRGNGRSAGRRDRSRSAPSTRTDKPAPLVPRGRSAGDRRAGRPPAARCVAPLDEDAARRGGSAAGRRGGVEAIAICAAVVVPQPGPRAGGCAEIVRELRAGRVRVASHEIAPRQGEYERTVATVINAYVGPASRALPRRTCADALGGDGLGRPLLVMQCQRRRAARSTSRRAERR